MISREEKGEADRYESWTTGPSLPQQKPPRRKPVSSCVDGLREEVLRVYDQAGQRRARLRLYPARSASATLSTERPAPDRAPSGRRVLLTLPDRIRKAPEFDKISRSGVCLAEGQSRRTGLVSTLDHDRSGGHCHSKVSVRLRCAPQELDSSLQPLLGRLRSLSGSNHVWLPRPHNCAGGVGSKHPEPRHRTPAQT
jgi:hypothetical protein